MREINSLFRVPLGMSELTGAGDPQWIATAASLAGSALSSIFGGSKAKKLAKNALKENQYRTNAEKAWYDKEYNTDYMDTKAGQNLMRRAQEVQDNYIRKADGAAAVGGGTAASTAMAKEAANRTMGNTIANIGAQDTARKQSVSDQHMKNEQALSQQRENIYNQQAQNTTNAAQQMSNSLMAAAPSLEGLSKGISAQKLSTSQVLNPGGLVPKPSVSTDSELLKKVTGV